MSYDFHPEALEEYSEAAHWYAERDPALAIRFVAAVEDAISRVVEAPMRWRVIEEDVRRCLTRVFPYGVLYTIEVDFILIVQAASPSLNRLVEADMRAVAAILISLKNRTKDDGNHIDFALGDWMCQADEWFGKDVGMRWMTEEIRRKAFRDHLLMLMGATLITLQKLENFINGCCSLLSLKTRKGKILNISDFLSPDAKHRSETLGELKEALKMTSLFDQGFELRLDEFVKKRNRFVHSFWLDTVKDSTYVNPPSFETLKGIEEFVSGLLREAVQLEAPFRGLYYSFGKGLAQSADTLDLIDNGLFVEWSKYEKDFLTVANVSAKPAK